MSGSIHNGRAFLLIDVFSQFHFQDGPDLARAQASAAAGMAAAAAACRDQGVCVVYCNDNFGQWQDTWPDVLAFTARNGPPESGAMLERLYPVPGDLVLLKSRHSAFFNTQLASLLDALSVGHLALGGAAMDVCVLSSAMDAHVRGLQVAVHEDAVAAASQPRHSRALALMRNSLGIRVCSHDVRLSHTRSLAQWAFTPGGTRRCCRTAKPWGTSLRSSGHA